ncbi:MAG TPA: class I SAM-dependent methyltransferase [Rhizomicrobium sp.]|jgi:SAM-dependent methyltransferase|nr:class I SAM-dependent methyltransferase [Rhizomicrobium sp.]
MNPAAEDHYFTEQALRDWTAVAERHRIRDEYFLRALQENFRPGSILEIGAATGHLSAILNERGYKVMASDVSPRFVAAIEARGVPAMVVDATRDIPLQTGRRFANVLAQNVIPLIRRDRDLLLTTLSVIHSALEPSGRLISINARTSRCPNPKLFWRPAEQLEIMTNSGLFRVVRVFPHQIVPTGLYRRWNAPIFNFADFSLARMAAVRLVSVIEKIP